MKLDRLIREMIREELRRAGLVAQDAPTTAPAEARATMREALEGLAAGGTAQVTVGELLDAAGLPRIHRWETDAGIVLRVAGWEAQRTSTRERGRVRVYRRPGVLRGEDATVAKAFLEGQDGYSPGAPRELAGGSGAGKLIGLTAPADPLATLRPALEGIPWLRIEASAIELGEPARVGVFVDAGWGERARERVGPSAGALVAIDVVEARRGGVEEAVARWKREGAGAAGGEEVGGG